MILIAVTFILVTACSKDIESSESDKGGETFVANSSETVDESEIASNSSQSIGSDTVEDKKMQEPLPTPFPTDDLKEYDGYGMTYKSDSNLKNSPENDSYVLKELVPDSQLHIKAKYGDSWYYAECDGTTGFIKRGEVAKSKAVINADEVKLRKGPGTNKEQLQILSQLTDLYILSQSDDWYKIVLCDENHTKGYVFHDYVSYHDGYVTADDVRIRVEPNKECKTITRIEQGKRVSIICRYNDYYKVTVDEYTGFMAAEYIAYSATVKKMDKQRAYINDNGVNFREGPSTDCKSIQRLAKYSPIYVTGETDEWYRVTCNDIEGYISKDFVQFGKLEVYVIGQDVNLRSGPGTGYDLLTKVRQNSKFEIIGCEGDWLKGIVNHNTGYIRSDYLSSDTVNGGKKTKEFTSSEIKLAAKVVYLEAKGYGKEAYRAVANVIYNRVKSHRFPNNVKGVVYQSGQFSVINHRNFNGISPSSEALEATKEVLNDGIRPLPFNVLFFHIATAGKNWGSEKEYYKTIGDNAFFRYVG